MKLVIGNYEIELKARNIKEGENRMNKQSTIQAMADMELAYWWAGKYSEVRNYKGHIKTFYEKAHEIHEALKQIGYYGKED